MGCVGAGVVGARWGYDEVLEFFGGLAGSLVVGDSLDPSTQIGPLASERQRERVVGYIEKGRAEGARVVVGGGRPEHHDRGWFVEPTVFADVDNRQTIPREDIFGPVLAVIPYDGDDEAVAIANDSEFGLGGSPWATPHHPGETPATRPATRASG